MSKLFTKAIVLLAAIIPSVGSAQTTELTRDEINSLYKDKKHSAVSVHAPST